MCLETGARNQRTTVVWFVADSPEATNYDELYADAVADGSWVVDFSQGEFGVDRLLDGLALASAQQNGKCSKQQITGCERLHSCDSLFAQKTSKSTHKWLAPKITDHYR
jgi:hypothetical protein